MANEQHLALLKQGVDAWNEWRKKNPGVDPDLSGATLDLADLRKVDLRRADLQRAQLDTTDLQNADLSGADLRWAHLTGAKLQNAKLMGANLRFSNLLDTDLTDADLTGASVYGTSTWKLKLEGTTQRDLIITEFGEPEVTVDSIEVAQFIYLLLNNQKIRDVIDTIGKKAVLILGRFTPERKVVLDTLREELRKRDYVPILFDFDKPATKDLTATISILAQMARFIIADLTDPSSLPYELAGLVPTTPVPVQTILLEGQKEPALFEDLQRRYRWVLATHFYANLDRLIIDLSERVIGPAERKVLQLRGEATKAP